MYQVLGVWDNHCSGAQTFLSAHVPVAGAVAAMLSDALSCFFAQCHFLVFASMLHVQSSAGSPSSL